MYQLFYDLFVQHIFTGAELDTYQQLVCTELSTVCAVAMLALPMFLVWRLLFR